MRKTTLVICALAVAGLVGSTFAADAKSQKHHKQSSTMSSTTTGANMKSRMPGAGSGSATPSSQGNVGPGTNNNQGPAPGGR